MRLAAARDFRSRTRLPQTAATATASGSRAHQEHKMRFLVNRIIERGRLDAARRQPDRQKHERGMREERQEDRLAAGARRAVARRKQRFGRLPVERQRGLLHAPRVARGVVHADESGAGNETQFAAAKQCTDGLHRHAGGTRDFLNREDFTRRNQRHWWRRDRGKSLASFDRTIRAE